MGKIYEALERAQRDRKILKKSPPVPSSRAPVAKQREMGFEKEMILLYQNIDALLPESPKKVIQFIGSREGEGTSTVVSEFARISSKILDKSVLLLDAEKRYESQSHFFSITPESGLEEDLKNEEGVEKAIAKIEKSQSSVCLISQNSILHPKHFYSPKIEIFWEKLKERFDLVLIDSPPASKSPDGIVLSRRVDGVVLVLEAEKTRGPVVESLKEQIQNTGGNLLGIVFNKHRHYIPEFLYKRL
jgi:Mrp family chromosome partitioning ATPase